MVGYGKAARSTCAWCCWPSAKATEISRGADEAWDRMRAAFDQARTHFEKK